MAVDLSDYDRVDLGAGRTLRLVKGQPISSCPGSAAEVGSQGGFLIIEGHSVYGMSFTAGPGCPDGPPASDAVLILLGLQNCSTTACDAVPTPEAGVEQLLLRKMMSAA